MIYEGVNFNEKEVVKMSQEDFEAMHIDLFWKNRDEAIRKKMLAEIYGMIRPAKSSKKAEK